METSFIAAENATTGLTSPETLIVVGLLAFATILWSIFLIVGHASAARCAVAIAAIEQHHTETQS